MALKTRYSPFQHFSMDNLMTAFADLSTERKAAALVVLGLVIVLILFLPLSLVSGKVSSLKKEISSAQNGYAQVVEKAAEYERTKTEIEVLESRFGRAGGALTTRIEGAAKQAGLTVDQVKEKAPQETDFLEINSLEVKISNVVLTQLMDLLFSLENDKTSPMQIRKIQIKPKTNNRQILDVSFEVATFAVKKEIQE